MMHQDDKNARRRPNSLRGFTLIELLVVIGIIVLLASLVLAVSGSVVRASEERATRNTLEILNAATEEYERVLDRRVAYRSGAVPGGGIAADPLANATNGLVWDIDSAPGNVPSAALGNGVSSWASLQAPYSSASTAGLPAYSPAAFRRTAHLLWAMSQSQTVAPILQKLPETVFRGVRIGTGQNPSLLRQCVDSWDTPIIAIFPGREATQAELDANNALVVDPDGTVKSDSEWQSVPNGGLRVSCKNRRILWVSAGVDTRFNDVASNNYALSSDNLYSYEP